MPSKSQHGRNKRTVRNKPRVVPAAAVTPAPKPAVSPAPAVTAAALTRTAAVAASHPYLMADLKRIGLLTGIIVVVMLVLYFVMT